MKVKKYLHLINFVLIAYEIYQRFHTLSSLPYMYKLHVGSKSRSI